MVAILSRPQCVNSYFPGLNGRRFADDIFECIFHEWKEFCSKDYYWQNASIGPDNGLAPNRRQAITWTNTDPVHWRLYAALGGGGGGGGGWVRTWAQIDGVKQGVHLSFVFNNIQGAISQTLYELIIYTPLKCNLV